MLVPLSWLAERVELRGSVAEICDVLTGAGIETEIGEDARPSWDGVVTARLESVEQHPNADRLTVTKPFDGSVERTVVCGATNHKAGDVVALATHGTVLPGNFKIKKGKIRGVPSEGMLCSTAELGLGEDADGILILPADTPLGVPLAEVMQAGDVVLEVSPTANRGDCLSILGLARELSAVTGWPLIGRAASPDAGADTIVDLHLPTRGDRAETGTGERLVTVRIDAPDGCPRYTGAVMTGVTIQPSPDWMQQRLTLSGVRPINNVVDCTNYVMLELGNPLHAFDRRTIRGDRIVVRRAAAGEGITTLDGGEHALTAADLVIADAEGTTALAGVMGGLDSEVKDDTATLFLEAAHFEPGTVRATAHRCKLGTESSYRFARGVDPELPRLALMRLIELLQQTAGAEVDGVPLDVYPAPAVRPDVTLRLSRVKGLLGLALARERVFELLERDGLSAINPDGFAADPPEAVRIAVPSYRFDLEREVDILEEIARLHGYDELPEVAPSRPLRAVDGKPAGPDVGAIRDALVGAGLSEAIHFSFIDPAWVAQLGVAEDHPWRARPVTVSNPLSEVGGILRPTLLPSLLRAASRNRAQGAEDVRLFELRRTFLMRDDGFAAVLQPQERELGGPKPSDKAPTIERRTVAGVIVGRREPGGWSGSGAAVDFFDVRAAADAVLQTLGSKGWDWSTADLPPFLDPRESATLQGRGGRGSAGWVGRIAVPVLRAFDLDVVTWAFELDLDSLAPRKTAPPKFQAFSRFPGVERDLAVVVADEVSAAEILGDAEGVARKGMKTAFRGVEVFDVYRGEGIPAGHRSIALRFRFRSLDRTLEDGSVDGVMNKVVQRLERRDGVTPRT
jgi:phenylalanyl-tRNA synthetase beta chain